MLSIELRDIYTKNYIVTFIFLLLGCVSAEAQTYWMQRGGGLTTDEGMDISIDDNGNTYTTGYFSATASFGNNDLVSAGVTDIFLTKLNPSGVYQWAIRAGGSGSERALCIKTDGQGNSYITGFYYQTASFENQSITSSGAQDVFIAKYNNSGVLQWVKTAGGVNADIGNGITIDDDGNVFVTGEFSGTATFGGFSLTSQDNSVDIFTVKLDNDGNFLWARKGSAPYIDRGIDLACDLDGNVYVTGQFSDTITFEQTHNNNMFNAIFIIKYDGDGNEQWFRRIGGGAVNVVRGIVAYQNSHVYITGDFEGTAVFFGPPNTNLSHTYDKRIFIAKYGTEGTLSWASAASSESELHSKNIAVDGSGNPYIVGNYRCKLSSYADEYGQGIFNSVGFSEVFVAKYNSGGAWQFSRTLGSRQNDFGNGITVNSSNQMHITGSYSDQLFFTSANPTTWYDHYFIINSSNNSYCNDPSYFELLGTNSVGSADVFIANNFDPNREPYDYYVRTGSGCDRSYLGVCADISCADTFEFCKTGGLSAYSHTYYLSGPEFDYLWSTGSTEYYTYFGPNDGGVHTVTQTTADGCFVSTDTFFVDIHHIPEIPLISDNIPINNYNYNTDTIYICETDSVLLIGHEEEGFYHFWEGPSGFLEENDSVWVSDNGTYYFVHVNEFDCEAQNQVVVQLDYLLPDIDPRLICWEDEDMNDSITICENQGFNMFVYDTISNPNADSICIPYSTLIWTVTSPNGFYVLEANSCGPTTAWSTAHTFYPDTFGWYFIDVFMYRQNLCGADTFLLSDSIYVDPLPSPQDSFYLYIEGDTLLCPGEEALLVGHSSNPYPEGPFTWYFTNTTIQNDSIVIDQEATYRFTTSYSITNSYGCTEYYFGQDSIEVQLKEHPVVNVEPVNGLLCPNDSVKLECTGDFVDFEWQGPFGSFGGNNPVVYVNLPGAYYCIGTDADGCQLISNTVQVDQYTTPFLIAYPSEIYCLGDSVEIHVVTSEGSVVQWLAPLSGSDLTQTVSDPGTYTCSVNSCNITTLASITVQHSGIEATITPNGPLSFCIGDSVILQGDPAADFYEWLPGGSTQEQITVTSSGTYTLIASDLQGCLDTNSVQVNVSTDTIIPTLIASPDSILCNEDSVEITLQVSPGSPIQWQPPLSGSGLFQTVNSPGTYTCIVTACGATEELSITVSEANVEAIITPSGPLQFCDGDSVILSANDSIQFYNWEPGNSNQQQITVFTSGTYTLTTSDISGCSDSASISVIVYSDTVPPELVAEPDTVICNADSITIEVQASPGSPIEWLSPLSGSSLSQVIDQPGTYSCNITSCGVTYQADITITQSFIDAEIDADGPVTFCVGDSVTLQANSGPASYLWQPGGSMQAQLIVYNSGSYTVVTSDGGSCSAESAAIIIETVPNNLEAPTVSDTSICPENYAILVASGPGSVFWYDQIGAQTPISTNVSYTTPVLNLPATYYVVSHDEYCESEPASATVSIDDCEDIEIPNVFTPNGDNVNETFVLSALGITCFEGKIYNRWGRLLYEWNDVSQGWDGTIQRSGAQAKEGVYYYIINYCDYKKDTHQAAGFVELIR